MGSQVEDTLSPTAAFVAGAGKPIVKLKAQCSPSVKDLILPHYAVLSQTLSNAPILNVRTDCASTV